jgi:hypothetical protein
MKNANNLLVLSLFSFLQTPFNSGVLTQPANASQREIHHATDAFIGFLLGDAVCICDKVDGPDTDLNADVDQSNNGSGSLQMVCTRNGCLATPVLIDLSPSVPVHQEATPSLLNKDAPRYEAPGMLAGSITES